MTIYTKDPDALLDYSVDWSSWLADGETLDTVEWIVEDGLTNAASSATGAVATIWLSGGTVGATYRVTCRVSTSAGRVDDRSFAVRVGER